MGKKFLGWVIYPLFFVGIGIPLTLGDAEHSSTKIRHVEKWVKTWKFHLGDILHGEDPQLDDRSWRILDLPHDWSIEGEFRADHPATPGGGALPGGIGWYRKTFFLPEADRGKLIFVDFDGIYRNGEIWINGYYLGKRPYGYSSFRYELTPYLHYGDTSNVIAVRVDNSQQPNSRWYSGSGIYRNVWLVKTSKIFVDHWGTFVTTASVCPEKAKVSIQIQVKNVTEKTRPIRVETVIFDQNQKPVTKLHTKVLAKADTVIEVLQECTVKKPILWSLGNPYLYTAVTFLKEKDTLLDDYYTPFGIRHFAFDREKGFFLNGKKVKINGVCNHHDLGCLGAAINTRAIERQLEILKAMGCNAIRTSHNPPAPELLDLCDRMGFIVMDEAFDMWKKKKTEYDYAMDFDSWYRRDLEDMILRDRNHPSVFIWSIGNEVIEQWDREDTSAILLTKELVGIVKRLDTTRPVTSGCNNTEPWNPLFRSGALDLIGFNYSHQKFHRFLEDFPGQKFIASETVSAWATRGTYNMPSDSVMNWPFHWDRPFVYGNPDFTCSAYDNCHAPWGTTHEETWRIVKKYDFISGMFIWSGFDYLGEPAPYFWPARSSYFGIIDLAGFPKDVYYMYQSEWTEKPMLYIFPHWNWKQGDTVDVWAYTNLKTVELFLNGVSLGEKRKGEEDFHLMWRIPFVPGALRAVAQDEKNTTLVREIKTAGPPAKIELSPDRAVIKADGFDLSFITVKVTDAEGNVVPHADQTLYFDIQGPGKIVGVDNGYQASHEPFKANHRKAYHGLCLVVVQSAEVPGEIVLVAKAEGLESASVKIQCK